MDWKVALMNASRRVSYASNASLDELSSYLDDIPVSQNQKSELPYHVTCVDRRDNYYVGVTNLVTGLEMLVTNFKRHHLVS